MKKLENATGKTRIYLVENCYGDINKVYIGKTISNRERKHKLTFGPQIIYTYIDGIDSTDRKDWEPLESYWIEQFRQWGFEVLNQNKGGGGPEFHTEETKRKMSESSKGKPCSEETRKKISEGNKGKIISEETKKKMRCKTQSEESKKKMSEGNKGRVCTEETRKKISEGNKGKIISEETKKKMRCKTQSEESKKKIGEAHQNKIVSKETCKKISESNKGKTYSKETKQKMSESAKGRIVSEERRRKCSESNSKPILQYDLEGNFIREWKSATVATKTLEFKSSAPIGYCCLGKYKTSHKFIWKFKKIELV